MKIEFELTETAWEVDYQTILKSIERVEGKEPLAPAQMALHLFKLGIQSYKKEMSDGGMAQGDIVAKTGVVTLISGMTQKLIDHYKKHNALAEDLRAKVKDPAAAFQAVKAAVDGAEKACGKEAVTLFKHEIFLTGIASVFGEIDEVLGGPKTPVPEPVGLTPWGKRGNTKPKKKPKGGKR